MPDYCCTWNYKNNPETSCRRVSSYIKPQVMTMFYIPTTWRRNTTTTHAMYYNELTCIRPVRDLLQWSVFVATLAKSLSVPAAVTNLDTEK